MLNGGDSLNISPRVTHLSRLNNAERNADIKMPNVTKPIIRKMIEAD